MKRQFHAGFGPLVYNSFIISFPLSGLRLEIVTQIYTIDRLFLQLHICHHHYIGR